MRPQLIISLPVAVIALLVVTNPVVSEAAGQITGKQIRNGSVTGKDIKDKSVTAADVSGSIAGPQGPTGPTGATGPQGAAGNPGSPGPAGSPGLSNLSTQTATMSVASGGGTNATVASCPNGTSVIGGGIAHSISTGYFLRYSRPTIYGWQVQETNTGGSTDEVTVYALCATVQQ